MNLHQYFATQCRTTAVKLKTTSPEITALVKGKKRNRTGTSATLGFDGFNVDITYLESGRTAYAQQTIWLSFVLDCDRTLPYSVYDILAFLEPDNFNCYTYTYVDSQDLMHECFKEIHSLLSRLVPMLQDFLKDGTNKHRLIDTQRKAVNKYFGDSVIESSELIGAAADDLINMMLRNFRDAQVECAVIGGQGLFYSGKDEKALKKLKKSKYRTQYHDNLIKYIEAGGSSDSISCIAKEASAHNGASRHGYGKWSSLKTLGLALAIDIPVTALLIAIVYITCSLVYRDSLFYTGFYESLCFMPIFGILLSVGISLQLINRNKNKNSDDIGRFDVYTPQLPDAVKSFYKYFTIIGECLALFGCLTSIFSTTVFYKNSLLYSEGDFPVAHSTCPYSAIDSIVLVNGFYEGEKFYEQKHIAIVTKIGTVTDLYNSTWCTAEDIIKNCTFADDYDIEIKTVNTIEDLS